VTRRACGWGANRGPRGPQSTGAGYQGRPLPVHGLTPRQRLAVQIVGGFLFCALVLCLLALMGN
jgi:hypothetical protein